MAIDLQRYWADAQPLNLLRLITEDALLHLLNGFSYAIGAGVSVVFPIRQPFNGENMDRRDAKGDQGKRQFFSPFCRAYREDGASDEECKRFDAEVATQFYSGELTGPTLYRCYMQLWDMTYPLRVGSRLLGVVFAGQISVDEETASWKEALCSAGDFVRWDTFNEQSPSQTRDIIAQVVGREMPESLRAELARIVSEDPKHRDSKIEGLLARWAKFMQFGDMLQSLLNQLYERTMNAARERTLSEIGVELTTQTTKETWWSAVAHITLELQKIVEIERIDVYSRSGSRYVQKVGDGKEVDSKNARRVPVRACISIPVEELTRIDAVSGTGGELQQAFAMAGDGYVFRCDYKGLDVRSISTILVLHDHFESDEIRRFAAAFCHNVGVRADLRELLRQIESERKNFSDRTRRAAHSSRMPLSIALADIELAEAIAEEGNQPDYKALIGRVKEQISDSETEISEILARIARPRNNSDIRNLVGRMVEEMRPLAARRNCTISTEMPRDSVLVQIAEPEIRVALRNLLDNAIKYSFTDHEIRLRMTVAGGTVVIVFDNYGVGIPAERLKLIRDLGFRAEVHDPKFQRAGFGVGLSVAIQDIEAHGGSLEIVSYPADTHPRTSELRWVTKVTVTLPVFEEMEQR
jgi:signal transduction histidine kinase